MKNLIFFLYFFVITFISSCANIFNATVLPNQCKECKVINIQTGQTEWTVDGCGSENTRLEEKAKIQAYEMSRSGRNLCDLEVKCRTWTKDPNESQ